MVLLDLINRTINRGMPYRSDSEHYGVRNVWTAENPRQGGDCKHYALAKQQALLEMGFPRQNLRLAVVRTESRRLHAVLTVITERGDFVLDNRRNEILTWNQTGYFWLSRQSARSSLAWSRIAPG
jgi:predicted transglutaminase-like cysteine proteinase